MGLFDKALKIMDEQQDNQQSFEPIPEGDYQALISNCELKPTKRGDGQRLNITHEITAGKHTGRLIFNGLNVLNPNDDAVAISLAELHRICIACNAESWFESLRNSESWEDAEQMIENHLFDQIGNKPLTIRVKIKEDKSGEYGPQNKITKYTSAELPIATKSAKEDKSEKPAAKRAPWQK